MTIRIVTDEQLGQVARRQNDLFRRVRDGALSVERVLGGLQNLIEGQFDAFPRDPLRRLIDCDVLPFIPDNWTIESHQKGGQLEFDHAKVVLHLDDGQKDGRTIVGGDLRRRLEGESILNACVLDHLLANTNLIPEAWKQDEQGRTRHICFWGTVYCDSDGNLYVRYLCWYDGGWRWGGRRLGNRWDDQDPAAVSAS